MATRLKTIEYSFPVLASLVDNTLTSLTQISVYIPEASSTVTFKKVTAIASAMQTATSFGPVTTRQLECRLGLAAYTGHTNSNVYNGSGEDIFCYHALDLTSHFTTNWSGTSMTMDAQVLFDGTATAVAWTNVNVTVRITYEYQDSVTTQIKTVRIPLDCPTGALGTSKPGAALATIPNLSTELPEDSKNFRNVHIVIQGNRAIVTGGVDHTLSMQLDNGFTLTTGIFEGGQNTDYFFRYVWDVASVLNTSSSMGFYLWSNATKFNHLQAWLVVTYEFDATASNNTFVSVMLPMDVASPMGGQTAADFQRATRELWIQEPGTITTKQIAFYSFWEQSGPITGLSMRIGTGSFVSYTDTAAVLAGSNAAMVRNDSAFSLTRGRNIFNFDAYRTDAINLGDCISGFWIINYTCSKPSQGCGAANQTIFWNLGPVFDGAGSTTYDSPAISGSVSIPGTDYFINAMGIHYGNVTLSSGQGAGAVVFAEILSAEGGGWSPAYVSTGYSDAETGLRNYYSQIRSIFKRWSDDVDSSRVQISTSRRWRAVVGTGGSVVTTAFHYLDLIFTYHSISYTVSGNITNSGGGTVNVSLCRAFSNALNPGEKVLATTRSGDGSYSFEWFDNTENVSVLAYKDTTYKGVSKESTPATNFDISLLSVAEIGFFGHA